MCSHKHEPDTYMWVHQNMSRLSGERDGVSLSKLTHSLSLALGIAGQCLLAVSSVKLDWKNMQYLLYNFTLSTFSVGGKCLRVDIWIIVKHTAFKPKLSNIVIENINFPKRRNLQSSYWTMHDVFSNFYLWYIIRIHCNRWKVNV